MECAFNILKVHFWSLDESGGSLQIQPQWVCDIIHTCVIQHNIAVTQGLPLPAGINEHVAILLERQEAVAVKLLGECQDNLLAGQQMCQQLVNNF